MGDHDVTALLRAASDGDPAALGHLIPLVYDEIRQVAAMHMRRERADHTLQPTALAHEAYVRLLDRREPNWESRTHFLGVASQVIRRVLVEHARGRDRLKRGGGALAVTLSSELTGEGALDLDVLALDAALERLGQEHADEKQVVELRFFGGLSVPEIAELLGTSTRTVERRWAFARAWLFRELRDPGDPPPGEEPA